MEMWHGARMQLRCAPTHNTNYYTSQPLNFICRTHILTPILSWPYELQLHNPLILLCCGTLLLVKPSKNSKIWTWDLMTLQHMIIFSVQTGDSIIYPRFVIMLSDKTIAAIKKFEESCTSIAWQKHANCNTHFPDIQTIKGKCSLCIKYTRRWTARNNIDMGQIPAEVKNPTPIACSKHESIPSWAYTGIRRTNSTITAPW